MLRRGLLKNMAMAANFPNGAEAVGESSIASLKIRPDYAVTVHDALIGFVEVQAPGKSADPRKFKDPHDRDWWEGLRFLPHFLDTDGNSFSLWQNGELASPVLTLIRDVESPGKKPRMGVCSTRSPFTGRKSGSGATPWQTTCNHSLFQNIAHYSHDPVLKEVAIQTLDDPDPEVTMDAPIYLMRYGDASDEEPILNRGYKMDLGYTIGRSHSV